MKLKEFLEIALIGKKEFTRTNNDSMFIDDTALYGVELKKYVDIIKSCDEFANCESLDILTTPIVKGKGGETYTTQNIKLSDLVEFKGKCYLLSLSLTPEMYDSNLLIRPVKNGAAIGPVMYDPKTFEPKKHILLTWSPEMVQDVSGTKDEVTLRNDLHKLLDDVLDNPEEYRTKGTRHVFVRGLFEVIDNNDGSEVTKKHYDVDLTVSEDKVGYIVYYLEHTPPVNGEIKLEMKNRVIPSHLKDKFIEELGTDVTKLNDKVIEDFLEKQGINRYAGKVVDMLTKSKNLEDRISEIENNDRTVRVEPHKFKY